MEGTRGQGEFIRTVKAFEQVAGVVKGQRATVSEERLDTRRRHYFTTWGMCPLPGVWEGGSAPGGAAAGTRA